MQASHTLQETKHLNFDKYGAVLMVQGKTGDRRIRLVACTVALQNWREDHPCKNDPESYLWCKTPLPNNPKVKNNHLSYGFISRLLKEPAMREFFGWEKESDMPATYVHLSGRDIDNKVLSIYGYKDVGKSHEPVIKTWNCQRCNDPNDPARNFCKKCGMPDKVMEKLY